ncbi:hypothetical protein, partial [Pseudomonas taetrolens]|uniref:hypothetical protein n=1 Tax=Pseudomonas taetrolens TaxID=47884 RepID=UPI003F9480E2
PKLRKNSKLCPGLVDHYRGVTGAGLNESQFKSVVCLNLQRLTVGQVDQISAVKRPTHPLK